MSFDDGFVLGLSMGGSDDYKNRDPDFALYKAMEEPKADEMKALVRVVDDNKDLLYIVLHTVENPNIQGDDNGIVDWGDGSSPQGIGSATMKHTYTKAGDYIITVTANDNYYSNFESIRCMSYVRTGNKQAYFIALKVGKNIQYDDGAGSGYIGSDSNFKYMQFGSGYVLGGNFRINNCKRLTAIDILDDSVKPKILPNYMFDGCNALDFRNIMPLLLEVEVVGDGAFSSCYGLKKLTLPKCTRMGSSAVNYCSSLTHVNLPECLEIGSSSLRGNYSLREVNLPKCQTIGDNCLENSYILNKITVPDNCSFGSNAMKNNYCLIPTPNGIYP